MDSVGTCSDNLNPGIRADLVGIEIPVTSLGDLVSVVSVLFIIEFKVAEVDCVWGWEPVLVFLFDFWTKIVSATVDWIKRISSLFWSIALFAVIARLIILGKSSSCEKISVRVWSILYCLEWRFSVSFKNGSNSCSMKSFEKALKQLWSRVFQINW